MTGVMIRSTLKVLLATMLLLAGLVMAEKQEEQEIPSLEDQLDPKKWGIQNNCIHTNRIRSIKFIDEKSAIIKISGDKAILMKLKRRCPGVTREGIIYETRNGRLCGRFDYIRTVTTGISCQIVSFEPYVLPDEIDETTSD